MDSPTINGVDDILDWRRFEEFYNCVLPMVYGFLWRRTGGREDVAMELTEGTFIGAVQELHSGTALGEPVAWVMTLARRQLANHHRSQGVHGAVRPPSDGSQLSKIRHRQARLASALESLSARDQLVLQLRYVDDWPLCQVADLLRMPLAATESFVARARRALTDRYETQADV